MIELMQTGPRIPDDPIGAAWLIANRDVTVSLAFRDGESSDGALVDRYRPERQAGR